MKTIVMEAESALTTVNNNETVKSPDQTVGTKAENNMPLPVKKSRPLVIALSSNITSVEFNGKVASSKEEQDEFVLMYLRNKVLSQFGVAEVDKNMVTGGKLYFNGNRTTLKLPKIKEATSGAWSEDYTEYLDRVKPLVEKWLLQSDQNSRITWEFVGNMFK